MAIIACSLHPMDVRLLKMTTSAMHGGTIPDFTEEGERRAHRDIVLNWSRKIIRAATPLADTVPREQWLLYTHFRPFFITADDPEQAAACVDQLLTMRNMHDVLNFFLEQVARLDPEQADEVVATAQQDTSPGLMPLTSAEDVAAHLRAYLLYERRQLEMLASAAGTLPPEQLVKAGRLLAWRTCHMLADLEPSWVTRATSLTNLVSRRDLGLETLVADPRGIYREIVQKIPGLLAHIPVSLNGNQQTGLCITPKAVPAVLNAMAGWPQPILPHASLGVPTPAEVLALREALVYARSHNAGLWEASDMVNPEQRLYPQIQLDQGDRDEHPEKFSVAEPVLVATTAAVASRESVAPPPPVEEPVMGAGSGKSSWFKKILKR